MSAYEQIVQVRFEHCDPAGIVFYPRYFAMINRLIEDWFAEALDTPWPELHGDAQAGVPTVRIEIDFTAPSRQGDRLRLSLDVREIGRASFTLLIEARGAARGDVRFRAVQTLAYVAKDETGAMRATAMPERLARAMRACRIDNEGEPA